MRISVGYMDHKPFKGSSNPEAKQKKARRACRGAGRPKSLAVPGSEAAKVNLNTLRSGVVTSVCHEPRDPSMSKIPTLEPQVLHSINYVGCI